MPMQSGGPTYRKQASVAISSAQWTASKTTRIAGVLAWLTPGREGPQYPCRFTSLASSSSTSPSRSAGQVDQRSERPVGSECLALGPTTAPRTPRESDQCLGAGALATPRPSTRLPRQLALSPPMRERTLEGA